jgi:hypothetical protein
MNTSSKLVPFTLLVWFSFALAIGLTGLFESVSAPIVAVTVWTLTAIVLLGWWKIPGIQHWIGTVDLSALIALHLSRFVGIYFLILCRNGSLSGAFAKPAGIGDLVTAIGAALLLLFRAANHGWRTSILIWNIFGLLDILFVVFAALRVGLIDWQGMSPLRALPLMLLPMFLVPLIIACHIVIFVRLAKWRGELVSSH